MWHQENRFVRKLAAKELRQPLWKLIYIYFHFRFQELCNQAYLILRRHSNLLISLFTMMLSCGIPELQTLDDISYLRKTLQVEHSEEQALTYFTSQFRNAYGDQWTTKVDWMFHFIKNMWSVVLCYDRLVRNAYGDQWTTKVDWMFHFIKNMWSVVLCYDRLVRNAYGDQWTTKVDWMFHFIKNMWSVVLCYDRLVCNAYGDQWTTKVDWMFHFIKNMWSVVLCYDGFVRNAYSDQWTMKVDWMFHFIKNMWSVVLCNNGLVSLWFARKHKGRERFGDWVVSVVHQFGLDIYLVRSWPNSAT